jgi:hypothetical protein
MKSSIYSLVLAFFTLALTLIFWPGEINAQPIPQKWGATTNGLQLGINVSYPFCMVFIRNVSTNQRSIYIHRAPEGMRYKMQLLDPKGRPADIASNQLLDLESAFRNGGTLITNEPPGQLTFFSISDVFRIETNGLHTIIISERFTTNQALPFHPNQKFDYFLMPPVTNAFMVSSNDLKK